MPKLENKSASTPKNPNAVALGKLGGAAGRGESKRRNVSPEQARAAVAVRWEKYRARKTAEHGGSK